MFTDLDELLDGDLRLRVNGKTYRIPEPTALEGLRLQRLFADPDTTLSDADEVAEMKRLMGPVWAEMYADDVPDGMIAFSGRAALLHYAMGERIAETYVRGGIDDLGNPLPPLRERRGSVFAKASAAVRSRARRARTARGTPAGGLSSQSSDCGSGSTT